MKLVVSDVYHFLFLEQKGHAGCPDGALIKAHCQQRNVDEVSRQYIFYRACLCVDDAQCIRPSCGHFQIGLVSLHTSQNNTKWRVEIRDVLLPRSHYLNVCTAVVPCQMPMRVYGILLSCLDICDVFLVPRYLLPDLLRRQRGPNWQAPVAGGMQQRAVICAELPCLPVHLAAGDLAM